MKSELDCDLVEFDSYNHEGANSAIEVGYVDSITGAGRISNMITVGLVLLWLGGFLVFTRRRGARHV